MGNAARERTTGHSLVRQLRTFGLLLILLGPPAVRATETENHVLRMLPAPGKVTVDGKFDDWDLSGGIFACGDVERLRDQYGVWFHAMYDADNVYFLARWRDPTPLNNEQSSKGGHGFGGDCLQVRFITGYKTDREAITWLTCWRDRDGISVVDRASPGIRDSKRPGERLPNLANALEQGARQAFRVDADGKGYVQELAVPWPMLTADGKAPAAGAEIRVAVEPNFTAGPFGRISIKDIFREGVAVDRVFTFRAYDQWGTGVLEKVGQVKPAAVRLADGRAFPVHLVSGLPVVDWAGLIQTRQLPGFVTITLNVPFDGYVSLNLRAKDGTVARQLLAAHPFGKGRQEIKWDGLATPTSRTPGGPLPAGEYTWEAIAHPRLKVALRGWAASAGQLPWMSGPTAGWGGDHGTPDACAASPPSEGAGGGVVYLGWNGAEAGKAVVACDLDDKVRWRIGTGIGLSSEHLAVDGGVVYSLGWWNGQTGRQLVRLRVQDGVFDNWRGRSSAALEIPDLWAGRADAASLPPGADAMDVKDGTLYLAFGQVSFSDQDVTDWKAFAARVLEGGRVGERLGRRLNDLQRRRLADFVAGKLKAEQVLQGPQRLDSVLVQGLNALLEARDLAPSTAQLAPGERAPANRRFLEKELSPVLRPLRPNFVAVCDANSGEVRKLVDVPLPGALRAVSDSLVYVISGGRTVLALNPQTGAARKVVTGLHNAVSLAVDADGRLYVGVGEPDHQVKIFTAGGKPAGTIGHQGGRPRLGPWRPDGLFAVAGMAVDKRRRLWVTESDRTPKRVSVWDLADGKLVHEFFGPTHYGASGAAINPLDPDVMVSEGCEWRLDAATGRARCTGVFDNELHSFAVFCAPANGRLYLAVAQQVDTATSQGQHTRIRPVRIFERVGEGDYRLRATITPQPDGDATRFWSDADDNQREDAGEAVTLSDGLSFTGSNSWSLNLNPADLTLYATSASRRAVLQLRPAGFTRCGAPRWDPAAAKALPVAWSPSISGMLPDADNRRLVVCEMNSYFRCYDLASGRELWTYPNPFFQVHGSHKAPPAEPGLIRGAFGLIGTARLPGLGTVWGINTNVGEWHLLTEDGFYLSRLFQSDLLKQRFPEQAVPGADLTDAPSGSGGEDFGGSLVQGRDGRVYVQTGKTAAWNTEVTGFAGVKKIGHGTVRLSPDDLALARAEHDRQLQAAAGTRLAEIRRLTPKFSGSPGKDFVGVQPLLYRKQDDAAVKTWAAWDDDALYLGWEVLDPTPWVNGAGEPAQMYVSGDTVDFQFAADPRADPKRDEAVAGDFRVSVGNYRGRPTAVLYRKVSAVKRSKAFSSGVVKHYEMDFVDVLAAARVEAAPGRDGKGYAVELAVPWKALGFTPTPDVKYRGDFGVTHGDPGGTRTRLRTYWNNQETGLVDDAVFELKMVPRNWGELVFRQ